MPTFAAVDIGSNSVRLKIAKVVRGRLVTLHEDREVTRLGESVFANGALDPQAMALTLRVLRRFHRAAQTHAADRVRVVATSALRDAAQQPRLSGLGANRHRLESGGHLRSGRRPPDSPGRAARIRAWPRAAPC